MYVVHTPGLVSIIIPARNERFLSKTIQDLLSKARGEIEIIAVLEGYWPQSYQGAKRDEQGNVQELYWETPGIIDDKRVIYIHNSVSHGMRNAINQGVAISKGEYILKCDAHTLWGEGYDEILKKNCEDNWVVVPRRKRLDPEPWGIQDVGKPDVDYEYLSFPDNPADFGGPGLNGRIWTERILERLDKPEYMIDEDPSFQGSGWFMKRSYFDFLELMDDKTFGPFWNEAQEIGFKSWLSGGKVMINKNTFYAHLHKGKTYGRGYSLDEKWLKMGTAYTRRWIVEDKVWHKQLHPLQWLIEHFYPMPTWPEDRSLWKPVNANLGPAEEEA